MNRMKALKRLKELEEEKRAMRELKQAIGEAFGIYKFLDWLENRLGKIIKRNE